MMRIGTGTAARLLSAISVSSAVPPHSSPELDTFIRQDIGLGEDQIAAVRSGQPIATALSPRIPAEVLLFGSAIDLSWESNVG